MWMVNPGTTVNIVAPEKPLSKRCCTLESSSGYWAETVAMYFCSMGCLTTKGWPHWLYLPVFFVRSIQWYAKWFVLRRYFSQSSLTKCLSMIGFSRNCDECLVVQEMSNRCIDVICNRCNMEMFPMILKTIIVRHLTSDSMGLCPRHLIASPTLSLGSLASSSAKSSKTSCKIYLQKRTSWKVSNMNDEDNEENKGTKECCLE